MGLKKGVVDNLDDLFIFARLVFVKRVEHADAFERAFAYYFYDLDIPAVAEGDYGLFDTEQFRRWLEKEVARRAVAQTCVVAVYPRRIDGPVLGDLAQADGRTSRRQQMDRHPTATRLLATAVMRNGAPG